MAASLSAVIDQVKFDLISKTQAAENAAKRKEIARTFICRLIYFTGVPKAHDLLSRYYHRLPITILTCHPYLSTSMQFQPRRCTLTLPMHLWVTTCTRSSRQLRGLFLVLAWFLNVTPLSTRALEAHMAKITGKEAALFMPSGTASNQIALRTHLKQPPYTILCDHRSHINKYFPIFNEDKYKFNNSQVRDWWCCVPLRCSPNCRNSFKR
jgi:hypothetical protein